MSLKETVEGFFRQSERVLAVTHKPKEHEYRQMAITTAIGIALIGMIGFLITMGTYFIKGGA